MSQLWGGLGLSVLEMHGLECEVGTPHFLTLRPSDCSEVRLCVSSGAPRAALTTSSERALRELTSSVSAFPHAQGSLGMDG